MRDATTRRRSAVGIRTRLVILVALPITAMCLLAGSVLASHRSSAQIAEKVDRGVSQLRELADLRAAIHTQQSVLVFNLRSSELGVNPNVASATLGIDMEARQFVNSTAPSWRARRRR